MHNSISDIKQDRNRLLIKLDVAIGLGDGERIAELEQAIAELDMEVEYVTSRFA